MWTGMLSGVALQTLILIGITLVTDWNKEVSLSLAPPSLPPSLQTSMCLSFCLKNLDSIVAGKGSRFSDQEVGRICDWRKIVLRCSKAWNLMNFHVFGSFVSCWREKMLIILFSFFLCFERNSVLYVLFLFFLLVKFCMFCFAASLIIRRSANSLQLRLLVCRA